MPSRTWLLPLGAAVAAALVVSGINPHERATWWMEVLVVLPLLVAVLLLAGVHDRQLARMPGVGADAEVR